MGWSDNMSSVLGVSKDLIWRKFKLVNLILLISVIGVISTIIISQGDTSYQHNYSRDKMVVLASIAYPVGILFLVRMNELVFSDNRYRLIPVTEIKLYFSNLITTSLVYCYFGIMESVIFLTSLYYYMHDDLFVHLIIYDDFQLRLRTKEFIIIVLSFILVWTVSTMIHLVLDFISNRYSVNNHRLLTGILNILVIGLAGMILFFAMTRISSIGMLSYNGISNHFFQLTCLVYLIGIVLSIAIGLYFLKNHTETVR